MSSSDPGSINPPPSPPRSILPVLFGTIALILLVIFIASAAWFKQLRNKQVEPPPPVLGSVSAPTFTDENGTSFTISQLDGRIWVIDFIFTRCGGQCPVMSIHMQKLQQWLKENEQGNVKLVSVTVDPEYDQPPVLKRYAKTFKADEGRWHFLTGDRKTIYDYIINDFKLGAEENADTPVAEMFVHSDKFVLMDRDRNIRGYYSGTDEADMAKIRTAIISLSQEAAPPPPQPAGPTPTPVTTPAGS